MLAKVFFPKSLLCFALLCYHFFVWKIKYWFLFITTKEKVLELRGGKTSFFHPFRHSLRPIYSAGLRMRFPHCVLFSKHLQWNSVIMNSVVNDYSVETNRFLSQIGYYSTEINPVITNPAHNEQKWSKVFRFDRVWLHLDWGISIDISSARKTQP